MHRGIGILSSLVGALALSVLTTASVASGPKELNMGSLAPKGTPWMDALEKMESQIEQDTNGAINVILRPAGVMSEVEMVRETQKGERFQGAGDKELPDNVRSLPRRP